MSNDRRIPRSELFSDPAAAAVWASICTLDEGAQHLVLAALQERLALPHLREVPQQTRVARAIAALREAWATLVRHGTSDEEGLTVCRYRELREQHPECNWPPDPSIRRWLGGTWNDALKRAHLKPVADGDALVRELGGALTFDEAISALHECSAELDRVPTFSEYKHWAKRPDVKARPGRRPMSQPVFDRLFGGWRLALTAANLIDDADATRAPRGSTGQVLPMGYGFTREQLHAALREVAELLGRSPRVSEYMRARGELLKAGQAGQRQLRAMPSYNVYNDRYEAWDDALVDAGLQPLGGRATRRPPKERRGKQPRIKDDEMLEILREAYAALGDPFTSTAYMRWRKDQQQVDRQARRLRSIPRYDTIASRFGSWAEALRRAFGWSE